MKVVFVGDRPSKKNLDPNIAFVGTPSFKNLYKWIEKMEVSSFTMVNSYTHEDHVQICQIYNGKGVKFVALGNEAEKQLKHLFIQHFKLPHPSPRNRLLNNEKFIDSELEKCKNYLKGA
jgi:hypothetical protein